MLPKFDQICVKKSEVKSQKTFRELLDLYDITIEYIEKDYYILDGSEQDLHDFSKYWKDV